MPSSSKLSVSRRALLRGAGVCLALPLLESLAPRVRAQASPTKRLLTLYFPNGAAAAYFPPQGVGQGNAFRLSPILEPLTPLKSKLAVVSNLENYSPFGETPSVEPSHSRLCGAFLTCEDSDRIRKERKVEPVNATSMDQLLAQRMQTPLRSLQLGLSTLNSYEDGRHGALSRSISWASATEPLYKEINPQAVFDRLVASGRTPSGAPDPSAQREAERRRALRLSALDFVLESARSLGPRIGREDKPRLEQFLNSVRELEQRIESFTAATGGSSCEIGARPMQAYALNASNGYHRGTHASIMNDLIVMALRCDVTRVITHMLDDARSDFVYDHLTQRKFSASGSSEGSGKVAGYHGLQHAGDSNDGFATINRWLTEQVASLCLKLDAIDEGDGSLLDHTVVLYGGSMRGSDHKGNALPFVVLGGKGWLRADQHLKFADTPRDRPLRDLYFTVLNSYFGLNIPSFGYSALGTPNRIIDELLR